MSDREQHGLRGPVKSCVEETTFPGPPNATNEDGTDKPEIRTWSKTEYDPAGHLIERRHRNPDGSEWVERHAYDASGRLLKVISGMDGGPTTEQAHVYDERGRPLTIINSSAPDNPITFRYDERGRKTKEQISRPENYRPNMGIGGSPLEAADMPPNLMGGGSALTIYDEQDRPIEVQVRDSHGELMSRAIRIYDQQGRIAEEEQILESPEKILPAEHVARILQESGRSLEELRGELTKVMGGQKGVHSVAYSYDESGRTTKTLRRVFSHLATIETSYNERGDKAAEITREKHVGEPEPGTAGPPPYSEARFSYEYGGHDNWVRQTVFWRLSPDAEFQSSSKHRRILSYY